jgi:hypothetical protein
VPLAKLEEFADATADHRVDGGIEQQFIGSRSACLRQMMCDVAQTWDQSPNRLYVRR